MTHAEPVLQSPPTAGRSSRVDFDTYIDRFDSQVGADRIAPPTPSDCCSVEFASASADTCLSPRRELETPPACWDTQAPRPDFSVAISRRLGMIVVAVHGALSPTSSAQLRQVLLDLVDHLAASEAQKGGQ